MSVNGWRCLPLRLLEPQRKIGDCMRTRITVASATLLAAVLIATALPASASEPGEAGDSTGSYHMETALVDAGFDADVAAANGYEIRIDENGQQYSVPVTAEAQAREAEYASEVTASRKVTVYGPCGSSWIDVYPWVNGTKRVETGYSVAKPGNRSKWAVQVQSVGGFPRIQWPDGVTPASWSGAAVFSTGAFGGHAFVETASAVIQIDGRVCTSASPATDY